MSLLNRFSITAKHGVLLVVMSLGLLVITLVSYQSMQRIQISLDRVFSDHIAPASMLVRMQRIYDEEIIRSLHRYQNRLIDAKSARMNLQAAHEDLQNTWSRYESGEDSELKQELILSIDAKLGENLDTVNLLVHLLEANGRSAVGEIIQKEFYTTTTPVTHELNKLIAFEFSQVGEYRQSGEATLEATKNILLFSLLIIFSLAAGIFVPIMKNIQRSDKTLRHLNDKLTEISITDPLTRAYNRRYCELILPKAIHKCKRDKDTLAFAMVDIDYFKRYNDTYGHVKGDEALKAVARAMQEVLKRSDDYLFRLGGEEFGIVVSDITEESAQIFFEKLKGAVEALKIPHKENDASEWLTVSIGVTFVRQVSDESADTLIRCADTGLYEAKDGGRNRVVFHHFDPARCADDARPAQSGILLSGDAEN